MDEDLTGSSISKGEADLGAYAIRAAKARPGELLERDRDIVLRPARRSRSMNVDLLRGNGIERSFDRLTGAPLNPACPEIVLSPYQAM